MFEQKEIVLIPFPYSDLTGSKQRPALIISNSSINKTEDRICCLVTTKPHKSNVSINRSDINQGRLPFESFIKPHRIFTINEKIIKKRLCKISINLHKRIVNKLNESLKNED